MRIDSLYGRGRPIFSFEFFPPKTDEGAENLMRTAAELGASVAPDFISVTYGAGGSTRDRTHSVVTRIQRELGITSMAHLTCVGSSDAEIRATVDRLIESGVTNVLALRGDPPRDPAAVAPVPVAPVGRAFKNATDLIEFLAGSYDLSIGAACYPECHPEATSPDADLAFAKRKQDLGAGFLTTQLFFDNAHYVAFVERARAAGIRVPIVPGIMPITNVAQIERFTRLCGASIPPALLERLKRHEDDPAAVMATGIEHAIVQCRALLAAGAPGVHFYTLNKSHATRSILAALR